MLVPMSKPVRLWHSALSSFWLIPSGIIVVAIALAAALVQLDSALPAPVMDGEPGLLYTGADGARSVLSSIAGSMITVAGVVFSITLVALSLASSQYSSRVLRSFISNRVNQVVLGTFLGIFAYCEVVLRAVVSTREHPQAFVPSFSVLAGLLLGIVGVFVLVGFIHHIAVSIQASEILATIFDDTMTVTRRSLPEESEDITEPFESAADRWHRVTITRTGYLAGIDTERLLRYGEEHDTVVCMLRRVGDFVIAGTPILAVRALAPDDAARERLCEALVVARNRTLTQDMSFGIRQIVDVALKALSPGINDTTTAVMAVDYLTAILYYVAPRPLERNVRSPSGALRVRVIDADFGQLVGEAFDQIRQNAGGNVAILGRLVESMERLGEVATAPSRRRVLRDFVASLEWSVDESIANHVDGRALRRELETCAACLDEPADGARRDPGA